MRTSLKLTFAAALGIVLLSMLPGCSAAQREKAGEAAAFVGVTADEIEQRKDEPLGDVAAIVEAKLNEMHESGLLLPHDYQASLAALKQTLDEIDANLPAPDVVDAWVLEMRRFETALQRVADAPDDASAAAEAIAGAAAMAAPMAGPYGPLVALGGAALSAIVGAFLGRKQGVTQGVGQGLTLGVQRTALPIDDARDTHLEKELAEKNPGKRYLVVDRDKVAKSHVRNGVATTIEQVTSAAA